MCKYALSCALLSIALICDCATAAGEITYQDATGAEAHSAESLDAAIDAVQSGGTVYLTAGTYKTNTHVDKSISIVGEAANTTILDGGGSGRVIRVGARAAVRLENLSIVRGTTASTIEEDGAGILNLGSLHCKSCTLSNNVSRDDGGAVCSAGDLVMYDCVLMENKATGTGGTGGAIYCPSGGVGGPSFRAFRRTPPTLKMVRCLVSSNSADDNGGAIWSEAVAELSMCTLSHNVAGHSGGAIRNNGTMTLDRATIVKNRAGDEGGGVASYGTIKVSSTILAYNVSPVGEDCRGRLQTLGHNSLLKKSGAVFSLIGTDQIGLDPQLMSLGRGIYAPAVGSPVVDAGRPTDRSLPVIDQMGRSGLCDGDGDGESMPDIGAIELQSQGESGERRTPHSVAPPAGQVSTKSGDAVKSQPPRLHIVQINVVDVSEAKAFYTTVLGFEVSSEAGGKGVVELSSPGGPSILLYPVKHRVDHDYPNGAGATLIFSTDNIDRTHDAWVKAGVEFIKISWSKDSSGIARSPYGRFVAFRDPSGNVHELIEPSSKKK